LPPDLGLLDPPAPEVVVGTDPDADLWPMPRPARPYEEANTPPDDGFRVLPALPPDLGLLVTGPEASPVPLARPDEPKVASSKGPLSGPLRSPRPVPKPVALAAAVAAAKSKPPTAPDPTPETTPEPASSKPKKSGKGLCQDPRLQGDVLASFGSAQGCGVADPVRVKLVDDIALTTPATLDCGTAVALANWVEGVAEPAFRKTAKRR
jgi:hypothetical protein